MAYRGVEIATGNFTSTGVTFNARLLAMDYNVVFWADFVLKGGTDDLFYNTHDPAIDLPGATPDQIATQSIGLKGIVMINAPYTISEDARDAYYKVVDMDLRNGNFTGTGITLQRPFGKYRLIATDAIPDGYLTGAAAERAAIHYVNSSAFPAGFNALTGEVNTSVTFNMPPRLISEATPEIVTIGSTTYNNARILAFDYLFAPPARTVSFETMVYSDIAATQLMGGREVSNIPIFENKLTTVIGNFFTNEGTLSVIVSDPFNGEIVIDPNATIKIVGKPDSYTTIQSALAAVVSGETIEVPAGVYSLGTGISIPAGVTVKGAGKESTILRVNSTAGSQTSVSLTGTLDGVWVEYDSSRTPGAAWGSVNPTGVNLFAGATLSNSRVTGHRNGVYANNITGYTVSDNEILQNRTGIQIANGTTGTISGNAINDNETIGLLLQYLSDASNTTVPTITGNSFSGNWSSDFENRWSTTYVIDLNTANTFSNGTKTLAVAPGSGEGSSSVSFTKNDVVFKANVVTAVQSNIVLSGTTLQNSILMGGVGYATLTTALAAATGGETIDLTAGTFPINTTVNVNKAVIIKGAPAFASKITTSATNAYALLLTASATIDGLFFEKTNSTNQNIIGVQATNVTIKDSKFVGKYAFGGEVVRAIEGSNNTANLVITGNHFEALRQPAYLQGSTSGGTISNNFVKGTRGWVITEESNFALTGNTFDSNSTDIAIINNSQPVSGNYDAVAAISAANNGAYVNNQVSGDNARNGVIVL